MKAEESVTAYGESSSLLDTLRGDLLESVRKATNVERLSACLYILSSGEPPMDLPPEVRQGIERGRADIASGKYSTDADFENLMNGWFKSEKH